EMTGLVSAVLLSAVSMFLQFGKGLDAGGRDTPEAVDRFVQRWPSCAATFSAKDRAHLADAHGNSLSPDGKMLLVVTGDAHMMESRLGEIRGVAVAIITEGPTCRQWAMSLPQCRTSFSAKWSPGTLWVVAPIHVNSTVAKIDLRKRSSVTWLAEY